MALVLSDRVKELSTTTGTGSFTLAGAPQGFQTFNAGVGVGNTCYYAIADVANNAWEVGVGTLSGATTLARTTVLASSNANNLVNFVAGNKEVYVTYPANKSVFKAADGTTPLSSVNITSGTAVLDNATLTSATINSGSATLDNTTLASVTAQALRRSPNAVTAMFIYDTSKDSDGGAWTEKCQHTSWYNEPLMGKWLGAQESEFQARNAGATVSATELVTNGGFDTDTAWTKGTGWSISGGVATFAATGFFSSLSQAKSLNAGVTYKVTFTVTAYTSGSVALRFTGGTTVFGTYAVASGTYSMFMVAAAGNTTVELQANSTFAGSIDNFSVREVTALNTASGDYFQLTTDGKFYKLNATSGTTEVFRGNKAKFPKLAGIVAEGSNINIYDLTEKSANGSFPMWMRFVVSTNINMLVQWTGGGTVNSLAALNGVMAASMSNNGLSIVEFISDNGISRSTGFTRYKGNIAQRNAGLFSVVATGVGLVNSASNAVAMTVLPDAPVDPVTGLQVPTLAVATGGGVSVIKHNGTVASGGSGAFTSVTVNPSLLSAGKADTSWYYAANPGSLGASFTLSTATGEFGRGNTSLLKSANRTELVRSSYALVTKRENNASTPANSLNATITNTFNTGHQPGDIRRTYLADSDSGIAVSQELISEPNFATQGDWKTALGGISFSNNSVVVVADGTNNNRSLYHELPWDAGTVYEVEIDLSVTAGGVTVYAGAYYSGWTWTSFGVGQHSFRGLRRPFNGPNLVFIMSAATEAIFTRVSIKKHVSNRSYQLANAPITGTLTKSAVATNAQLVAYSGFSAANYLQEPYSADLDFGTGEWSVGAWVKSSISEYAGQNLFAWSEDFGNAAWDFNNGVTISSATDGKLVVPTAVSAGHRIGQMSLAAVGLNTVWFEVKPNGYNWFEVRIATDGGATGTRPANQYAYFNISTGVVGTVGGSLVANGGRAFIEALADGWFKCGLVWYCSSQGTVTPQGYPMDSDRASEFVAWTANGTDGVLVRRSQASIGDTASLSYMPVTTGFLPAAHRAGLTGQELKLGINLLGRLTATAYDGTTTRTVTTSAAYNTATWLKAEAAYKTDGSLAILVNGQEVAVTRGNPLLTLNNSNAVLTIGNSYALDAPFPGSIALLKLSATAPTYDQAQWMYEQEKQLFRDGAQCCLPDSGNIVDLTYDDVTDKWVAVSATNESSWTGLVRTNVTAVPAGSNSKVVATSGVKLNARTTTSPGVDVTIPAYGLREELLKDGEDSGKLSRIQVPLDYVGGFTATTVNGNTAITSVSGLSYPSQTTIIGARVSGTGIPANTTIVGVSGSTIYLSAAATAAGTAVQISFVDFVLPLGMEAKEVYLAGVSQKEGSTSAFTRLYDGFRETIRFGVAPSYTALIQIQAIRSQA